MVRVSIINTKYTMAPATMLKYHGIKDFNISTTPSINKPENNVFSKGKNSLNFSLITDKTADKFKVNKNKVLTDEDKLAPQIPNLCIKIKFKIIFNTMVNPKLRVLIFCRLVALRKLDKAKFINKNGMLAISTCKGKMEKLN